MTASKNDTARDVTAAGLSLLMVAGVYLDGWAHLNRPALETFFTAWHAILYSGFALLAVFILATGLSHRGRFRWRWQPVAGYGLAGLGVVVFAAGGIGDMTWHQLFGIEVAVDALVSPTHLVLLVGGMLMVTAPMRAARGRDGRGAAAATALSVAATAALAAFFLSYLSVFADPAAASHLALVPEGAPGHRAAELPAIAGLGAYLATTATILIPVLALRRLRSRLPAGVMSAAVGAVALLGAMLTRFAYLTPALAATAAAVGVDLSRRWWARSENPWLAIAVLLPLAMWAAQLAGLALTTGVGWPVTMWAGVVALTGLTGWAVGLLSAPAPPGVPRPAAS